MHSYDPFFHFFRTLLMGIFAKYVMGQKRFIEWTQCSGVDCIDEIGTDITVVWDIVIRPLLFGSIGAALDFRMLPQESLFKSILIVVIGLFIRLPTAFMSVYGQNLNTRERVFVAAAWTPKATVQAALCSVPLTMIRKYYADSGNIDELVTWGVQILSTAILAIIITAPVGLFLIQFLGPYLLSNDSQ
jgi:Kef-type K+ transport system membrane component KefB